MSESEAEILDWMARTRDGVRAGWDAYDPLTTEQEALVAEISELLEEDPRVARAILGRSQAAAGMIALLQLLMEEFERRRDPRDVSKAALAVAKFLEVAPVAEMSLAEIGAVHPKGGVAETKAAVSARIKRLCNGRIAAVGGVGKAAWQAAESACQTYARSQRGNQNRRKRA